MILVGVIIGLVGTVLLSVALTDAGTYDERAGRGLAVLAALGCMTACVVLIGLA